MAKELLKGNVGTRPGSHLGSAYLTVSFGPPKLTVVSGGDRVQTITVGLIQNMAVSQQRQIARLFEIGNDYQWMIPSKTRSSLQLTRVLYDGPSLLKYYAYGLMADKWGTLAASFPGPEGNRDLWTIGHGFAADHDPQMGSAIYKEMMERFGFPEESLREGAPGSGDFWLNLASDVFNNAIGIMIALKQKLHDGSIKRYGAVYLENCLVSSHMFSVAADSRVLSEQVFVEYERTTPLSVGAPVASIENILQKTFGRD